MKKIEEIKLKNSIMRLVSDEFQMECGHPAYNATIKAIDDIVDIINSTPAQISRERVYAGLLDTFGDGYINLYHEDDRVDIINEVILTWATVTLGTLHKNVPKAARKFARRCEIVYIYGRGEV